MKQGERVRSRESYINHFVRRMKERLGVEIDTFEVEKLIECINDHKYELVAWEEKSSRGVYRVQCFNYDFFLIFCYDYNAPVTVLTKDMKVYELLGYRQEDVFLSDI